MYASGVKSNPNPRAVRTRRYKLIEDASRDDLELYDLVSDPAELHDRSSEDGSSLARMKRYLARQLEDNESRGSLSRETVPLTEELREKLKTLGYVPWQGAEKYDLHPARGAVSPPAGAKSPEGESWGVGVPTTRILEPVSSARALGAGPRRTKAQKEGARPAWADYGVARERSPQRLRSAKREAASAEARSRGALLEERARTCTRVPFPDTWSHPSCVLPASIASC